MKHTLWAADEESAFFFEKKNQKTFLLKHYC